MSAQDVSEIFALLKQLKDSHKRMQLETEVCGHAWCTFGAIFTQDLVVQL